MKYYIYALRDPDSNDIRYIGKTNNCKKREYVHNNREGRTKKDKWIASLKKVGKEPFFEVIEECNETNWHEREVFNIEIYNSVDKPLLNSFKGIKYRAPIDEKNIVNQILNNGDYYIYQPYNHYKFTKGEYILKKCIVLKLENDEYLNIHGKISNGYYFVISNYSGVRYYISKNFKIYDEDKLPVIKEEVNFNSCFDGLLNSKIFFFNQRTIDRFISLLFDLIRVQNNELILKLENVLGNSRKSEFMKYFNKIDLKCDPLLEHFFNLIFKSSNKRFRYFKALIKTQYWLRKQQL